MVMLDANMILRYLLNDNQEMADTAERYKCASPSFVYNAPDKPHVFAPNSKDLFPCFFQNIVLYAVTDI